MSIDQISKASLNFVVVVFSLAGLPFLLGNKAIAQFSTPESVKTVKEVGIQNTASPQLSGKNLGTLGQASYSDLAQVTSVSELSDVKSTDWVFQALQSLAERYQCIKGYPDQTFRGQNFVTRSEFVAGLNACLSRLEALVAEGKAAVTTDDQKTLQKLQQEFSAELETLRGRLDAVEANVEVLEQQQFSTTTKLSGEVIFSVSGATGGAPDGNDAQITFNNRVRLNLKTSFTGKDILITGLQSYNFTSALGGSPSVGQVLFPNDSSLLGNSTADLSYSPQFANYNPQTLNTGCGNNSVCLYKLLYIYPVSKRVSVFAAPAVEVSDAYPAVLPFASEGQGSLSRFGSLNPVVRVSGGTSGSGLASAVGFIYQPNNKVDWRGLYGSVSGSLPSNEGFPDTPLGGGFFNGSYVISTQLTLKPNKKLNVGLNYANSYHQVNITGTGLSGADTGVLGGLPLTTPVNVNSFGASLDWKINPKMHFTTYGAYFLVNEAGGDAYTNLSSWMTGLYFPDALAKGNAAGLLFGQPLNRTDAGNGAALTPDNIDDRATPYHLEVFYKLKLNEFMSVTPGAFVLFNPEGDGENNITGVGVIRTTFTF